MTLKEAIREVESATDMRVKGVLENDERCFFVLDFDEPVLMNAIPFIYKKTGEGGWSRIYDDPDPLEGVRSIGLPE